MTKSDKVLVILFRYLLGIGSLFALVIGSSRKSMPVTVQPRPAKIARHHHERYDSTGYPDRLAGEAIPLAARIVAVADVYDALCSKRVYKPGLPHGEAMRVILEDTGHFDPALLSAFQRCSHQFERLFEELAD